MTGNYLNRLDSTFNGFDLGALIKENLDLGVSGGDDGARPINRR